MFEKIINKIGEIVDLFDDNQLFRIEIMGEIEGLPDKILNDFVFGDTPTFENYKKPTIKPPTHHCSSEAKGIATDIEKDNLLSALVSEVSFKEFHPKQRGSIIIEKQQQGNIVVKVIDRQDAGYSVMCEMRDSEKFCNMFFAKLFRLKNKKYRNSKILYKG